MCIPRINSTSLGIDTRYPGTNAKLLGFAFPTRRGWRFARNMMQLKDSQTNPKFDEQLGDEYFDLWEAFQKIAEYLLSSPLHS